MTSITRKPISVPQNRAKLTPLINELTEVVVEKHKYAIHGKKDAYKILNPVKALLQFKN